MISIEDVIQIAYENAATDIHLSAYAPPKMRVAGELINMKYPSIDPHTCEMIIKSIMSEDQKEIYAKKGNVEFSYSTENFGRCRVCAFKQKGTLSATLRMFNKRIQNPVELGLPSEIINVYRQRSGLVLFTGPVGSGKSTVIASIIDLINENRNAHILTIEEPVEYIHSHKASIVNQREVGNDVESFESALKTSIKEDADVIYTEKFTTMEIIESALKAAEGGKLVISSMNTTNPVASIDRIINIFPPEKRQQIRLVLSESLVCIVSRQMIFPHNGEVKAIYEILQNSDEVKNAIIRDDKEKLNNLLIIKN